MKITLSLILCTALSLHAAEEITMDELSVTATKISTRSNKKSSPT